MICLLGDLGDDLRLEAPDPLGTDCTSDARWSGLLCPLLVRIHGNAGAATDCWPLCMGCPVSALSLLVVVVPGDELVNVRLGPALLESTVGVGDHPVVIAATAAQTWGGLRLIT